MAQVDMPKPRKSTCFGMIAGLALLGFAGVLFMTTSPLGNQAFGRRLQATTVANATTSVANVTTAAAVVAPVVAPAVSNLTGLAAVLSVLTQTTLSAPVAVGATSLSVASNPLIFAGVELSIDSTNPLLSEVARVKSYEVVPAAAAARRLQAAGTVSSVTLEAPLTKPHSMGAVISVLTESIHQQIKEQISSGSSASLKSIDDSSGSIFESSNSLGSMESGSMKDNIMEAGATTSVGAAGGSWILQLLLFVCYGVVYKSKVVDPMGILPEQGRQYENADDFQFGLCDCFKDCHMCMMVTCCPLLRIAHTNAVTGVCGFWETMVCLWCSTLLCGVGPCCMNVYFRIHVKDHMGIEDHCVNDMILAWCCLPCITGQQGLAVDSTMGFHFKCPCTIERAGGYGQIGLYG